MEDTVERTTKTDEDAGTGERLVISLMFTYDSLKLLMLSATAAVKTCWAAGLEEKF